MSSSGNNLDIVDDTIEIREAARLITKNLLPNKSGDQYKQCYDQFVEWQKCRKTESLSESTMLVYFEELSKKLKPSTVWSKYSMIKSTVLNFRGVDIAKYRLLSTFLSKNSKGFISKKSKVLEPQHIEKFLKEAPDNCYLAIKVALICGIMGACRREELKNISIHDIEHHNNMVLIRIRQTKNDLPRKFTIDGDFYEIFKKFEALRPENAASDQFFLCLRDGKCTQQVIGINTFGAMPRTVAEYLKLENAEKYTGHSFLRTSATMLADAGADLLTLKRHGGWKSDKVAMGYVEDSVSNKKKICTQICSSINLNRLSTFNSECEPSAPKKILVDAVNVGASSSENSSMDNKKENSS